MSWLKMINRHATEQEAEKAVARLKPMIEAADASNQDGENAVVNVIHAYDHFDDLVKALEAAEPCLHALVLVNEATDSDKAALEKVRYAIAKAKAVSA